MQTTLLDKLKIASCRLITDEELYRIRSLPTIKPPDLRQGDFAGLVNLQTLTIEMDRGDRPAPPTIHSGTFAGLITDRVRITNTTIENGAFDNAQIKYLSIQLAEGGPSYDRNDNITDRRIPGQLPSTLPPSLIRLHVTGDLRLLDWRLFQALPKLEYLSLTHDQARSENTPIPSTITIPAQAFSENTALRGLKLQADSSTYTRAFRLPADLLANHQTLSYIDIYRLSVNRSLRGELPIEIHRKSPAGTYVAEQGLREWNSWENTNSFRITVGDFPTP